MLIAASNRIDLILQIAGHNNYLNHGMSWVRNYPFLSTGGRVRKLSSVIWR